MHMPTIFSQKNGTRGTTIFNFLYHHFSVYQVKRGLLRAVTLFGKDFLSCDMMRTARASPLLLPVTRSPRNLIPFQKCERVQKVNPAESFR